MAFLQPTGFAASTAQITVTGATAAGTLIFNATPTGTGVTGCSWIVDIANVDADAGDDLYIGFTAATTTVAAGFPLGIRSETTGAHTIRIVVPPHAKVYANCADGETRDVRLAAYPVIS